MKGGEKIKKKSIKNKNKKLVIEDRIIKDFRRIRTKTKKKRQVKHKEDTRKNFFNRLRYSLRPLKNVKIILPTPRALSRKTGSRRFSNAFALKRGHTI